MDISALDMELLNTILLIIAVIGTVAYAISGALTGIESKLDMFGVVVLSVITATGGGFLRDLIMGKDQFVIFDEWWYPLIAFAVACLVFLVMWFIRDLSWEDSKAYRLTFLIIDSIGLGAFVIVGVLRAQMVGNVTNEGQLIFYSLLTCVGGSLLRDLLVMRIPAIFRKHIYAVAAIIGSIYFVFMAKVIDNIWLNSITTVLIVVTIRFFAARYKWNFPKIHLKNEDENK